MSFMQQFKKRRSWLDLDYKRSDKPSDRVTEQKEGEPAPQVRVVEPGPPVFTSSPRRHLHISTAEMVLQPPPNVPSKPATSFFSVILPVMGVWLGVAPTVFAAQSSGTNAQAPLTMFAAGSVALLSAAFGISNIIAARRKFKHDSQLRELIYHRYLGECESTLKGWVKQQSDASLTANPKIEECLEQAKTRHQRLWEREPASVDFLDLRLGIGKLQAAFKVKPPEINQIALEPDPLLENANKLAEKYRDIEGLPIVLPLAKARSAGIFGDRTKVLSSVRSMLIQLATHHAPNEVKVVVISSEIEVNCWKWARWLPHLWDDDHKMLFFITDKASRHQILASLEGMLQQRQLSLQDESSG